MRFSAIKKLRDSGLKVDLYPDNSKIDKQYKYAEKRNIPYAVIVSEKEIEANIFKLKNLSTGEVLDLNLDELLEKLS